jgi:capsule polysaccharide export protein KpsE/RkpR
MASKCLTQAQVDNLTKFVQPYWHDETKCAAEVAMGVIKEQQDEISALRSQLETSKADSLFWQGQVAKLRQHLEQIKYVLGDQPSADKVLDTMRVVHDNAKLTEFVGKALMDTYERNVKSMVKPKPDWKSAAE